MKKFILALTLILTFSAETLFAQTQVRTQAPAWRRNTAIVLFSGVAGGLLGLSTLSFYGDAKEHTNNITIGTLLGIIGGTAFIVYENAPKLQRPYRNYDYYGLFESEQNKRPTYASVPSMNFDFTF